MVAQEHQGVVESLVVKQILKSGSQIFPCVSILQSLRPTLEEGLAAER